MALIWHATTVYNAVTMRPTTYIEAQKDEAKRNRVNVEYSFDIINKVEIPFLIEPGRTWVEPNSTVRSIIKGETEEYDYRLPTTNINETDKGMHLKAQEKFVADHSGQEILCEALSLRPCLKDECQLYCRETTPPTCREFKIAFRKLENPS